jgi:O-antigen ligase
MIEALKTAKDNYFIGLGTGAGPTTSASGLGVHNQFLDMLVTNGIIGFFVLVLLWVTAFYMCFRVIRQPATPMLRFYGMGLFASLIGIFFEAQCYAGKNKIMWLMLGFTNCLYTLNQTYRNENALDQDGSEGNFGVGTNEEKLKGAAL